MLTSKLSKANIAANKASLTDHFIRFILFSEVSNAISLRQASPVIIKLQLTCSSKSLKFTF